MPFDEEDLDPHGECRHEIERLRTALLNIAAGEINSDFVISDPPNWHKAFSDLQAIARAALAEHS